jgi:hypothetical protein
MVAGKVAEACAAFEQSHKLEPAIAVLVNLAACREKHGQLATAWGLFLDAERQTRSTSEFGTERLYRVVHDRAARLEPRVPKLTISVPDRSRIDGLEVLRDGERIPAVMWNRALPVDGGTYTITARVAGANEWSMRVNLEPEADTKTVDIPDLRNLQRDLGPHRAASSGTVQPSTLPRTGAAPRGAVEPLGPPKASTAPLGAAVSPAPPKMRVVPPGTAGPAERQKAPDAPTRRELVLPIASGSAAVMLFGALVLAQWGDSTYGDAKAEIRDLARSDSLYDSANHKRYAAAGFAAAGVGCAGVAVWLYLRERGARAESGSARTARVTLAPSASGIGVAGWF